MVTSGGLIIDLFDKGILVHFTHDALLVNIRKREICNSVFFRTKVIS